MLAFEPGCAPQPNRSMHRQQMIMDVINRRLPPLTEEEANLDHYVDQLEKRPIAVKDPQ